MVFVMWGRFMSMLQLTRLFGPMLRIIINMFGDIGKFMFIYTVVLCIFASISSLLFGELSKFAGFWSVFMVMFDAGFGNYDLFEDFSDFGIIAVIINCILLLNFVIAMLADTYAKLSSQSLGLYYDGVIARIPVYEDDALYGGLIIGSPPFNIFAVILVPLYLFIKDEQRLKSINDAYTKLVFAPIALLSSVVFAALSLLMVPFAYLKAVMKKFQNLLCRKHKAAS
eukprot:CAMPEP_0170450744 /NCGR_PEP_ID=MMETSP0123-20130129/178_1 /TAXON_ID=182087 /ORGANISM="Favella ehrenbergii, Strain Fehren 1" /LENGTH=225 /DNA_ID=CAMNT_0010712127 /DNA_START=1546 /DNA_END=2223 /DNA_ORIENTATION=+